MSVFFKRRGAPIVQKAIVTVDGTGDADECYVLHKNNKYNSAATFEVEIGDTVTFGVEGNTLYEGHVEIDGVNVLTVTSGTKTYDWVVPQGLSGISVNLNYRSAFPTRGSITVTTT